MTTPIPADLLAAFDLGRGNPDEWQRHLYSPQTLRFFWAQWLTDSAVGREVAGELKAQAAAEVDAHRQQRERDHEHQKAIEAERRAQEQWRLDPGTEVTLRHPRTQIDGQRGTVQSMTWRGNQLMADVLVDPLPPGHPEEGTPVRLRRSGFMPFVVQVAAEDLARG